MHGTDVHRTDVQAAALGDSKGRMRYGRRTWVLYAEGKDKWGYSQRLECLG